MKLLHESYNYLKNESLSKYLLLFIFIKIIINSTVTYIMILISDGNFTLISTYIILASVQKIFNSLIIEPIIIKLNNSIQIKFYKYYTYQYNKLTYECKNNKMHSQFIENIRNAYFAITNVIDWGLNQTISLFLSFTSVFITFSKKGLKIHLLVFLSFYSLFYYFVFKKKQKNYNKIQRELQDKKSQNNAKEHLYSIPFQYEEIDVEQMINIKKSTLDSQMIISQSWNNLLIINDSVIEFISIILIYVCSTDVMTFMLIVISMNKLSGSIQGLNNFMTQYQRFNNDFNNFYNFWYDDLQFKNNYVKLYIKEQNIELNNIEIIRGNDYTIKKDSSLESIKFLPNSKVLIQGPSGHGKSSFLKAFFGLLKSSKVEFSYGSGIQYYHSVSEYFQEIKEKMPSSKVSLRDYFKGETNNDIIKEYLLYAWNQDEYDRIIDSIKNNKTNNNSESELLITIDPIHEYDLLINEKLSGGQKSRLILWTRGYNTDKSNKEIIILDEPCPDVDFNNYVDNLNRFYLKYSKYTIFLVSHLCECKKKALKINFDIELWIENGLIKQI